MKIIVLKPFVEVRTGRSYQPGQEITDPAWQDPASRKAEAYAARGMVRVEDSPAGMSTDMGPATPPAGGE